MTERAERLQVLAPPDMRLPRPFLAELTEAYAHPLRVYHTLDHAVAVAREFDLVRCEIGWQDPEAVYLAVLAHDAVYEPGRTGENERRSGALARQWADAYWPGAGWGERAEFLVRQTADHYAAPIGEDRDLDLFLDCDLAVLGAEPSVYDAYAAGIRAEYEPLFGEAYRAGRAAFLERLLTRESLFRSEFFRERLESPARRNAGSGLPSVSLHGSRNATRKASICSDPAGGSAEVYRQGRLSRRRGS